MKNVMPLPYCVYVLHSLKDHKNYIGYTSNLLERLKNHNSGGTRSTASRRPLELIFCEFHQFKQQALKREKYLKSSSGKRYLKLILKN